MIAYNKSWLFNLQAREAAKEAYDNNCIGKEEYRNLLETYPTEFYTPNLFLRIGMLVLTTICTCFILGLMMAIFTDNIHSSYYAIMVIQGLFCYGALEFFIKEKKHYRSGVDDALMWISAIMIVSGICIGFDSGSIAVSLLIFLFSFFYTARFADRLMAIICCGALISSVFFINNRSVEWIKALLPFIIMAVSAAMYFLAIRAKAKESLSLYGGSILMAEIFALVCFYIAGNYFVVRELSNTMFNLNLKEGEGIPFGFIFKILTTVVPLVYFGGGIRSKDIIRIRVGMLGIAASVVTYKYYNHFISIEAGLTIAGIILILTAWYFIRSLKEPKHGFSFIQTPASKNPVLAQAESLVIAETFANTGSAPGSGTEFGGGSFGGGGAGATF